MPYIEKSEFTIPNNAKKTMEDNHNFESFLGELSAELVNLPLESIDVLIENSMKKLVEFFDADRCHIGELLKDQSNIVVSYFYSRPGIHVPQITEIGERYLSFIYRSVKEEKILSFNDTSEIPEHSKKDRNVIGGLGFLVCKNSILSGISSIH